MKKKKTKIDPISQNNNKQNRKTPSKKQKYNF